MGREGLRRCEYSVDWTGLTLLQGGEVCRQNNKKWYRNKYALSGSQKSVSGVASFSDCQRVKIEAVSCVNTIL